MWVTLGLAAIAVVAGAAFVVIRHRKLDAMLRSLETCLKLD